MEEHDHQSEGEESEGDGEERWGRTHAARRAHDDGGRYDYRAKGVMGVRYERQSEDEDSADLHDFVAPDHDSGGEDEEEAEEEVEAEEKVAAADRQPAQPPTSAEALSASSDSDECDGPRRAGVRVRKALLSSADEEEGPAPPPRGRAKALLSDSEDDDAPLAKGRKRLASASGAAFPPPKGQHRRLNRVSDVAAVAAEAAAAAAVHRRGGLRRSVDPRRARHADALARLTAVKATEARGSARVQQQLLATGAVSPPSASRSGATSGTTASDSFDKHADTFFVDEEEEEESGHEEPEEQGVLACVCGAKRDDEDGALCVQCSNALCNVWMHAECVGYRAQDEQALWFCARCKPAADALTVVGGAAALPAEGFAPAGRLGEDVAPSEAATRAWRQAHGSALDVGAALAACLGGDNAAALGALLTHSRAGAVAMVLQRRGGRSLTHLAAESGATRCVRLLLRRSQPGQGQGDPPVPALCAALQAGKHTTARALMQEAPGLLGLALRRGAFDAGGTAVHAAAAGGDAACLALALGGLVEAQKRGALTLADDEGCTPLMLASGSPSADALRLILEMLGDRALDEAKRVDNEGRNALHYASSAGVVESITALAGRFRTMVASRDREGRSPLHLAACEGHAAACHALFGLHAGVAAKDHAGWTPLLFASGAAVLALLEHQPELQLAALTPVMSSSEGEARTLRLMRTLAEEPGAFRILNTYVSGRIHVLQGAMSFLLRRPALLDVANKRRWLQHLAARRRSDACGGEGDDEPDAHAMLWASRESAFSEWASWCGRQDAATFWQPLWRRVRLVESPQSYGTGVERELLELAARELATRRSLLAPSAEGGRALSPVPGGDSKELEALGVLLGYALANDRTLPLPLEPPFLRALLGRRHSLGLEELESCDPVYRRSLQQLLDAPGAESLGLTWCVAGGHELIQGGAEVAVTDDNKKAFVDAAAAWTLHGRCAEAVALVRRGFTAVCPNDWLAVLTEHDLALLLCGVSTVDANDWRAHTRLEGYAPTDEQVAWFWRCVREMSPEERGLLLKLSTGASAPPAGGFGELQGLTGPQRFTLQRSAAPVHRLPTASTCFNTLSLPAYQSFEELEKKVLAAVRFGSGGFEFV